MTAAAILSQKVTANTLFILTADKPFPLRLDPALLAAVDLVQVTNAATGEIYLASAAECRDVFAVNKEQFYKIRREKPQGESVLSFGKQGKTT